jgi:hypothetical protein
MTFFEASSKELVTGMVEAVRNLPRRHNGKELTDQIPRKDTNDGRRRDGRVTENPTPHATQASG